MGSVSTPILVPRTFEISGFSALSQHSSGDRFQNNVPTHYNHLHINNWLKNYYDGVAMPSNCEAYSSKIRSYRSSSLVRFSLCIKSGTGFPIAL